MREASSSPISTPSWRIELVCESPKNWSHKWFWEGHGFSFGKGTASAVPPKANKHAGFSLAEKVGVVLAFGWSSASVCVRTRFRTVWWNQAQENAAPEGRPSLAQRFSAGKSGKKDSSPGGTTEFSRSRTTFSASCRAVRCDADGSPIILRGVAEVALHDIQFCLVPMLRSGSSQCCF